jgi:hypothetical protein
MAGWIGDYSDGSDAVRQVEGKPMQVAGTYVAGSAALLSRARASATPS